MQFQGTTQSIKQDWFVKAARPVLPIFNFIDVTVVFKRSNGIASLPTQKLKRTLSWKPSARYFSWREHTKRPDNSRSLLSMGILGRPNDSIP